MTNQWSQTFRYWILSVLVILLAAAFWFGRELINPLVIGALLAFVLNPAIGFLTHRTRMSRSWAAPIVLFAGLGGLVTLSALMLGIITGVLTIIPDLGPAIAAALAAVVAMFEGSTYLNISNFWFTLLVIGIYLLLINIKGIWIRPRVFARSVHMHEGVVFIAIMAAVVLQGILGALVIVPVLASVGVLTRYIYHQLLGSAPWPPDELREATVEDCEKAL